MNESCELPSASGLAVANGSSQDAPTMSSSSGQENVVRIQRSATPVRRSSSRSVIKLGRKRSKLLDDSGRTNKSVSFSVDEHDDDFLNQEESLTTGSRSSSRSSFMHGILCFCLYKQRSNTTLRQQIMVPFGIVALLAMGVIMFVSVWTTLRAQDNILDLASRNVDTWAIEKLALTSRFYADIISQKLVKLDGLLMLTETLTQERFVGYPTIRDDSLVPFPNHLQGGINQYPWQAVTLLPYPHNVRGNVNATNAEEHMGKHQRLEWYGDHETNELSTWSAMLSLRTPAAASSVVYTTIHRKVSDYVSPLFKSLYEHHLEVKSIEIHFVNEGHGSVSVVYPARYDWNISTPSPDSDNGGENTSNDIGCEWLRLPNPYMASQPLLRQRQRANCIAAPSDIILKQNLCRQQALFPQESHFDGPFLEDGRWNVRFGRAIFDSYTHQFLACTVVVVDASALGFIEIDTSFRLLEEWEGYQAVVRWDDTAVVSAPEEEDTLLSQATSTVYAQDLSIGLDDALLDSIKEEFLEQYASNGTIDETAFIHGDRYISVYPSPPPPANSSSGEAWNPLFLNILALNLQARQDHLQSLRNKLDPHTRLLIQTILIAGLASLVATFLVLYVVSLFLTLPLKWMDSTGQQILESAGLVDTTNEKLDLSDKKPWWDKFSPPTEVSKLVEQFCQMIKQFSGQGTAKLFKKQLLEVKNPCALSEDFKSLYRSTRGRKSVTYPKAATLLVNEELMDDDGDTSCKGQDLMLAMEGDGDSTGRALSTQMEIADRRLHEGPNVHQSDVDQSLSKFEDPSSQLRRLMGMPLRAVSRSSLFWWIVLAIAVPIVCWMGAISIYVMDDISRTFPEMVDVAGEVYTGLERDFLIPFARLRATYIAEIMSTSIRDLHVLNRMAGWVFMGAIQIPNQTVVEMASNAEVCKNFIPFAFECPLVEAQMATCDCAWDDPWGFSTCHNFDKPQRQHQVVYFEGLREDAYPNGDRNFTTFPALATYPAATQYWPSIDSLPGSNSTTSTGVETTYSRAQLMSTLAIIQIPLYNYPLKGNGRMQRTWASVVDTDRDGASSGYTGCNFFHSYFAHFQVSRRASPTFNPTLCPNGKYGVDSRCIEWYVRCKDKAFDLGKAPLYVTPPTKIPNNPTIPTRATLPLIDSRTNEFLGQTSVRYSEASMFDILSDEQTPLGVGSFHLMIVAGDHAETNNVLVAPDFEFGSPPVPLPSLILPKDNCNITNSTDSDSCQNIAEFSRIVSRMQAGDTSLETFRRTSNETGRPELISLTFAPVRVRSYRSIDPSDFSRGVREYRTDLVCVALGQTEEALALTFSSSEEVLNDTLRRFRITFLIVTCVVLFVLGLVSAWISVSVAIPISQLCALVTKINRNETNVDFPAITGGSKEVKQVRSTFERLYKLVRVGNMAFFMGELDRANETLKDALALFTKLDNKKAMGIANNNLGNVMLTLFRVMQRTNSLSILEMSRNRVIKKGSAYFQTAVDLGEEALKRINDEEGFSVNYLVFMQQLSNRYFNRALFLLTVRDHQHPTDRYRLREQGRMDLMTCHDMDREVVDNGDHEGFKGDQGVYFELLLGRIKGLLGLMKLGCDIEPWDMDELLTSARSELVSALGTRSHPLFDELDPAGQMQRLDSVLIDYHMFKAQQAKAPEVMKTRGNSREQEESQSLDRHSHHVRRASEIAVRMMIEDDYVIGEAAMLALKALIGLTRVSDALLLDDDDHDHDDGDDDHPTRDDSRKMSRNTNETVRSKLMQYRQQIGETLAVTSSSTQSDFEQCLRACNAGDFSMEVF